MHDKIMNIPIASDFDYSDFPSKVYAYKSGHRDARHAAAEASLIADELLEALEAVVSVADRATVEFDMARAAISKARGQV